RASQTSCPRSNCPKTASSPRAILMGGRMSTADRGRVFVALTFLVPLLQNSLDLVWPLAVLMIIGAVAPKIKTLSNIPRTTRQAHHERHSSESPGRQRSDQ